LNGRLYASRLLRTWPRRNGGERASASIAECESRMCVWRERGANCRDWRSPYASGASYAQRLRAKEAGYDGGEEGDGRRRGGGGGEGELGSEVNVAQRRGKRMEQRPAATSARTRGLLAGVCLVWIIGGICATGKLTVFIILSKFFATWKLIYSLKNLKYNRTLKLFKIRQW